MPDETEDHSEQQNGEAESPERATDPAGGLLGRLAKRAAAAAQEVRKTVEERRPDAERAARQAGEQISRTAAGAAEAAKPEIERLAHQAKEAAEAARPRVEQAARDATKRTRKYVQEHEEDIRRAAGQAGRVAARGLTPRALRPAVDAFEAELRATDGDDEAGTPSEPDLESTPPEEHADEPDEDPKPDPPGGP